MRGVCVSLPGGGLVTAFSLKEQGKTYPGNAGILETGTLGDGIPINVALVLHVLDNVEEKDGLGGGRACLSFVGHDC